MTSERLKYQAVTLATLDAFLGFRRVATHPGRLGNMLLLSLDLPNAARSIVRDYSHEADPHHDQLQDQKQDEHENPAQRSK